MYDNIRFHLDEEYPEGLPSENAATHIGMYWIWAAQAGAGESPCATGPPHAARYRDMLKGRTSGRRFLLKHMDGALTPDDFTEQGQKFTSYYYDNEEDGYGAFLEDYVRTLDTPSLGGFYHVPNTPEIYKRLKPVFQAAFEQWKNHLASTVGEQP